MVKNDVAIFFHFTISPRRNVVLLFRYFKQPVSLTSSAVKISDEVPRNDKTMIETVAWTIGLESVFKQNAKDDPQLRYAWLCWCSMAGGAKNDSQLLRYVNCLPAFHSHRLHFVYLFLSTGGSILGRRPAWSDFTRVVSGTRTLLDSTMTMMPACGRGTLQQPADLRTSSSSLTAGKCMW